MNQCGLQYTSVRKQHYLYLKLAKTICLSYYLLCFLSNKIREHEGRTGSAQKQGWGIGGWEEGEVAQLIYTHVSKCKIDKRMKNVENWLNKV
jgi:hypothetical protein